MTGGRGFQRAGIAPVETGSPPLSVGSTRVLKHHRPEDGADDEIDVLSHEPQMTLTAQEERDRKTSQDDRRIADRSPIR